MIKVLFLLAIAIAHASGHPFQSKIVGGTETEVEKHPHHARVMFFKRYNCGGSIISSHFVLTAAHCTKVKFAFLYEVHYATDYIDDDIFSSNVIELFVHPNFNTTNLAYDVALLKTANKIDMHGASVVSLPKPNFSIVPGLTLTIVGWGWRGEKKEFPKKLHTTEVITIDWDQCENIYEELLAPQAFCALFDGETPRDACKGDSGGSAVINNTIVGIVSWGSGCGKSGYPGVYTNVPLVLSWILSYV